MVATPSTARNSFTLIELLVVVAILSVLAALLLPALEKAKEQAKRTHCMNSLKQVSIGLLIMADEHDTYLDDAHLGAHWIYAVTNYLGKNGSLVEYVYGNDISKACPYVKSALWGSAPYGVNGSFWFEFGSPATAPLWLPIHPLRDVRKPEITYLVSDCYSTGAWSPTMFDTTVFGAHLDLKPPAAWPRHEGKGLNFVFVDGHGEFLQSQPHTPLNYTKGWYRYSYNVPYPDYYTWCGYGAWTIWGVENIY
jgi:prepilin-type N-terminal cleavage/methylation domain-containing protein/prepilin-type processing-associated H-X9-DG protein